MSGIDGAVRVRRALAGDARALAALQRQIYQEDRWFVGDGAPPDSTLARRLRSADRTMSLWLVAEDGRQLCGWLELHRFPPVRLRHVAGLTLAVAASRRRQGVGGSLISAGYSWAERVGVRKISLNVRASNRAALNLYRRQGFQLEGREREQIRTDGGFEDNLIMAKFLDW